MSVDDEGRSAGVSNNNDVDLSRTLLGGAFWMFAMRWAIRGVGFFSIMVLARLLTPKDFGIVALANSLAALPTLFLELGVETAVMREPSPSHDFYNTAWTIRLAQMCVAALVLFACAPLLAKLYGDPRLIRLIFVLAIVLCIQGLENIWTVSYRRNLNFRFDFAFNASTKIASALMAAILAFALRSYWALVYAQLAGALFRVAVSLIFAPELPRLTLREWRSLWSFSQWTLVRSFADYAKSNADRVILGRIIGAAQIGPYVLGRELADLPISEISAPINRALGPGFVRLQDQPKRLASALIKVLAAVATLCFPVGVGLACASNILVPLLLGRGWEAAIPIVQILGLSSIFSSIYGVMGNTLVVIGYNHTAAIINWLRAIVLVIVGVAGSLVAGANGMAIAFFVCELFGACATLYLTKRYLPDFSIWKLLIAITRPALSAILMGLVVTVSARLHTGSPLLTSVVLIAIGAMVYFTSLLLLWRMSGRSDGPETLAIEHLRLYRVTN